MTMFQQDIPGQVVATVQARLKALNMYEGEINGVYGPDTIEAVIAFQKKNKIIPDGIAGQQVLKALKIPNTIASVSELISPSLQKLSQVQSDDFKGIGVSQMDLLVKYYDIVLKQADKSFKSALAAAGVGFGFFIIAVLIVLLSEKQNIAYISVISGALVEVISGINFFLYGKTTTQLANFHQRLNNTQRIILANSICESLDDDLRSKTRSNLVGRIADLFNDCPATTTNEKQT